MNIACIGTGVIVERMIESVVDIDEIKVIAIYSRSLDKASAFANKFNIDNTYDDLEKMLENKNIDAVYIASPNSLHFEHTMLSLKFDKNVFVEKPITGNLEKMKEIYEMAKITEKYVFETIYSIYLPNFKLLEREIKNIGNIKVVEANFSKVSSRFKEFEEGKLPNVFNPEFSGGALADLNIYNLHVIYKLFNKPNEINYMANQHENGIDLSGVLTMKYDDKLVICIASKESGNQSRAIIQGDQGFIEVSGGLNRIESLSVHKDKQIKVYNNQTDHHMSYEFKEFLEIIHHMNHKKMLKSLKHSMSVVDLAVQARKQIGLNFKS